MGPVSQMIKSKLALITIVIVIFLIVVSILYISVPSVGNLFAPQKPAPAKLTQSTPVGIACPVSFLFCRKPKKATYNNQPALLYIAGKGDKIFSMGKATSYGTNDLKLENKDAKVITTTFLYSGKCYTTTYVVPGSTTIEKVQSPPFPKATILGTLTGNTISLNNASFNLLVQLQARDVDPKNTGKTEEAQCSNKNVPSSARGEYITPNVQNFD